jgi:hypothetical protein
MSTYQTFRDLYLLRKLLQACSEDILHLPKPTAYTWVEGYGERVGMLSLWNISGEPPELA